MIIYDRTYGILLSSRRVEAGAKGRSGSGCELEGIGEAGLQTIYGGMVMVAMTSQQTGPKAITAQQTQPCVKAQGTEAKATPAQQS